MAVSLSHRDLRGIAVVDVVREWPAPFDPSKVVTECAALLKRYRCLTVMGDRYAAEWVVSAFKQHGITYQPSERTKSELLVETVAIVNSEQCELPDHQRLLAQFAGLQRRTGRSGKDSIDHRAGQRDDVCNAVAGALVRAVASVGLRAALPATFDTCINEAAATRCAFVTPSYPWFPSDPLCRRECPGLRAVRGVFQQHQQQAAAANEPMMNAAEFLRARFDVESSPLTARIAWSRLITDTENELGL